jgi:glycosyltransferase involved in cell wall biosynthesis
MGVWRKGKFLREPTLLDAVYVTYWSLLDPLCQSQTLPVLRGLVAQGWRLGLLTFEHPRWRMLPEERAAARRKLAQEGVYWSDLPYHRGLGGLSKVFDICRGVLRCTRLARRAEARLIHGRGTVAGVIGYAAARSTGRLFFNDADSPLSAEYVDAGIWRQGSYLHWVTRHAESLVLRRADALAVLTDRRRQELLATMAAPAVVLPCAVDMNHFRRDDARGASLRRALGLSGTVFAYVGKSGGWYSTGLMFQFLGAAQRVFRQLDVLILSPDDPQVFERQAAPIGLSVRVRFVERSEMPTYLSAADVGLSFIASVPSKAASSPIKNGEYLACGLPVVSTPGIGDYSNLVSRDRVGVIVESGDQDRVTAAAAELWRLLAEPGLRDRCRSTARQHASLYDVVLPRYEGVYRRLLGGPWLGGRCGNGASRG